MVCPPLVVDMKLVWSPVRLAGGPGRGLGMGSNNTVCR